MTVAEALALEIDDTRAWTLRLLEDLAGDEWYFQPAEGLAHPLWICGHLAVAQHLLIHVRCLNQPFLDESFAAAFPIGGPVPARDQAEYPDVGTVRATMDEVHARTIEAVRSMSDALLAEPAWGRDGQPHPHYRDKRGAVAHCSRHEAFHAGQLALIRRLLGKPFLR